MKKVKNIALWTVLIIGFIITAFYLNRSYKKVYFRDIEVFVEYGNTNQVLYEEDIKNIVIKSIDSIVGKPIGDVDLQPLKEELSKNPWVSEVEVSPTLLGKLKVDLIQKRPIFRVIVNMGNESYYVCEDGSIAPPPPIEGHPIRVLIASGKITSNQKEMLSNKNYNVTDTASTLKDIYDIVQYINKDDFLKAQISQIYATDNQEFELVPTLGNHLIKFGKAEAIPKKFIKLKEFYRKKINKVGWNTYKSLDLRYNNQVVGSKK